MKDEGRSRVFSFFFILHPSSFILLNISCHFNVAPALCYLNVFQVGSVSYLLCSFAANSSGRVTSSDNQRRDEEAHFVDKASVEKSARDVCAAFDQYTL